MVSSNKITDVSSPENTKRLKIVVCPGRLEIFSTCRAGENNKLGIVFVLWSRYNVKRFRDFDDEKRGVHVFYEGRTRKRECQTCGTETTSHG